jgi:hypothetical protein
MSVSPDVRRVLLDAADLIEARGWCQEFYACDFSGAKCRPTSADAACFCALGAIHHVEGAQAGPEWTDAEIAWGEALGSLSNAIDWNDAPERTAGEVVAKLREVAAA